MQKKETSYNCGRDLVADIVTHTHTHRQLTARQSLAMCRLSWTELKSMRRNSVRSIPDRLLQRRPSMSPSAKVPWRLSHKSHRWSIEPSELPGITGKQILQKKKKKSNSGHHVKHPQRKQTTQNENTCVCESAFT